MGDTLDDLLAHGLFHRLNAFNDIISFCKAKPLLVVPLDSSVHGTNSSGTSLLVEKCLFLEQSGCIQTCIHACKIPTQRFFLEVRTQSSTCLH